MGIAANSRGRGARVLSVSVGLAAAIVLHGVWDWAGLASSDPYLIFEIYGGVMVPVFLAVLTVAVVLRHREARVIHAGLPILVRSGEITAEEAETLTSLRPGPADLKRRGRRTDRRA